MGRMIYLRDVATLELMPERCTGCGMCMVVCPHAVFGRENGRVRIEQKDACMECGACADNCPFGALKVQAGVGCAAAVINSALGRSGDGCCCVAEPRESGAPPEARGGASRRSACC